MPATILTSEDIAYIADLVSGSAFENASATGGTDDYKRIIWTATVDGICDGSLTNDREFSGYVAHIIDRPLTNSEAKAVRAAVGICMCY